MPNEYYDHLTKPAGGDFGRSADIRSEFQKIETGFGKLPTLADAGGRMVIVNAAGSAMEPSSLIFVSGGELVAQKLRVTESIPAGDATDRVATTAFVASIALSSALPGQAGNAGKVVTTDGSSASWAQGSQMSLLSLINQGIV